MKSTGVKNLEKFGTFIVLIMGRLKNKILLHAILSLAFLFSGCGFGLQSGSRVKGPDRKISVEIPSGWKTMESLNAVAVIKVGDEKADAYLLVTSEKKAGLTKDTLESYSQFVRDALRRSLRHGTAYGLGKRAVGGLPALQYEIRGTSQDGLPLVYLHTVVESPDSFHQIVGWTQAPLYEKNRPVLIRITESFREN